jgi:hypothetical protein
MGVAGWLAIMMDMLALFILSFTTIFCIVFKEKSDPVMLAMLLSYMLTLTDLLNIIQHELGIAQRQMVSV